jgi:hypothetical protein
MVIFKVWVAGSLLPCSRATVGHQWVIALHYCNIFRSSFCIRRAHSSQRAKMSSSPWEVARMVELFANWVHDGGAGWWSSGWDDAGWDNANWSSAPAAGSDANWSSASAAGTPAPVAGPDANWSSASAAWSEGRGEGEGEGEGRGKSDWASGWFDSSWSDANWSSAPAAEADANWASQTADWGQGWAQACPVRDVREHRKPDAKAASSSNARFEDANWSGAKYESLSDTEAEAKFQMGSGVRRPGCKQGCGTAHGGHPAGEPPSH